MEQSDLTRAVGKRLREVRNASSVSQSQTAKFAGISRQGFIRHEIGADITVARLAQLLSLYGMDFKEFFRDREIDKELNRLRVKAEVYARSLPDNIKHRSG